MEDDLIFKMDLSENSQKIINTIKININYESSYNEKYKTKSSERILSKSPNVSFNKYIPPPSSSYNKKLNDLLKLYRQTN